MNPKKSIPAPIKRIIGEIGLRFRPAGGAALEDHRRSVELLAEDLSDLPADKLEAAAKQWVRTQSFMPRAADLVKLAQQGTRPAHAEPISAEKLRQRVIQGNRMLDEAGREDIRWVIDFEAVRLMDVKEIEARNERLRDPCRPEDVRMILAGR